MLLQLYGDFEKIHIVIVFTLCGYSGTAAQRYAAENGFRFVAADRFVDVTGSDYFFRPVMWAISR